MTNFTICVVFFVILFLIFIAHKLSTRNQNIFRNRGVEYEKPKIFFGNMLDVFLGKISEETKFEVLYEKFSREKLFGIFFLHRPVFVIKDVDLVKQIMIDNGDKFENKFEFPDELFINSTSKINSIHDSLHADRMLEKIICCAEHTVCNIISAAAKKHKSGVLIETDELFRQYLAMCVVMTALNSKNLDDVKANKVYEVTKCIEEDLESLTSGVKVLMKQIAPKFMKLRVFRKEVYEFFNVSQDAAEFDALNNNLEEVDHTYFAYFAGGFQATLKLLRSSFKELQSCEKLQAEIFQEFEAVMNVEEPKSTSLSYNQLKKFENLNNFVREIARRYPPVSSIQRICTKDCYLTTKDDEFLKFVKGDLLQVPLKLIQNDPKYLENSKMFEPKSLTRVYNYKSFIPFGVGSKKCPAADFVLLQTKILIFIILSKYSIANCDNNSRVQQVILSKRLKIN